jgi:hypothetical protein
LRADTRVAPVRIQSRITRFVEITAAEFESCARSRPPAGADEPIGDHSGDHGSCGATIGRCASDALFPHDSDA